MMAKSIIRVSSFIFAALVIMKVTSQPLKPAKTQPSSASLSKWTVFESLIKDGEAFNKVLASKYFSKVKSKTIILHFASLSLNNIGCSEFQLVERLQAFADVLSRFSAPMISIRSQLEKDSQKTGLANGFYQVQNSYRAVSVQLHQMLVSFQARAPKSHSPSVSELNQETQNFMTVMHPEIKIDQSNISIFRDYAFVQSMVRVVKIIFSELRQLNLL